MPTTSNDLAALVTGGSSAGSTSQMKGMLADLSSSCATSTSTESGADSDADFQTMLDTPANVAEVSDGAVSPAPAKGGQVTGDGSSATTDLGRCVLSSAFSGVAPATLHIKGMVSGLNPAAEVVPQSSTPVLAEILEPENETISSTVVCDGDGAPASAASTDSVPAAKGIKAVVGRGRCRPTGGLLTTVAMPGAARGRPQAVEGSQPAAPAATATESAPETVTPTLASSCSQVVPPLVEQGSQSAVPAPVVLAGNHLALALGAPSVVPAADSGEAVSLDQTEEPVASDTEVVTDGKRPRSQKIGRGWTETGEAAAHGFLRHAANLRPAGFFLNRAHGGMVSVANHPGVAETIRGALMEQPVGTLITTEQRSEIVASVVALIAPLLAALPQAVSSAVPVAPQAEGEATGEVPVNVSAEGEKKPAMMITIKAAGRQPITIALPDFNFLETDPVATPVAGEAPTSAALPGDTAVRAKIAVKLSAQLPSLSPVLDAETVTTAPLDFRIQLKAKIESTWAQIEPLVSPLSSAVTSVAGKFVDADEMAASASHQSAVPLGDATGSSARTLPPSSAIKQANLDVPAKLLQTDPAIVTEVAVAAASMPPARSQPVSKGEFSTKPVEVVIEMPGLGSVTAEIATSQSGSQTGSHGQEKNSGGRFGQAEKTAGDSRSVFTMGKDKKVSPEKTFLSAEAQVLKSSLNEAGTAVAISGDNMPAPFTSRRLSVDPLELPPRFNPRGELLQGLSDSQRFAAPAEIAESATPAPVLAHRAVETIMNVVDAQRNGSANATSVNLHFKFGGDDLAVRVQMRGGEVLTQFLTDSAELRSALSSEWQVMAGQGGAAGLRMLDPTILPASAGVSTGFGSASQGQSNTQQQQQTHQQQAQTAAAFSELRGLRRGTPFLAPVKEAAPRAAIVQPNSHHLAALA